MAKKYKEEIEFWEEPDDGSSEVRLPHDLVRDLLNAQDSLGLTDLNETIRLMLTMMGGEAGMTYGRWVDVGGALVDRLRELCAMRNISVRELVFRVLADHVDKSVPMLRIDGENVFERAVQEGIQGRQVRQQWCNHVDRQVSARRARASGILEEVVRPLLIQACSALEAQDFRCSVGGVVASETFSGVAHFKLSIDCLCLTDRRKASMTFISAPESERLAARWLVNGARVRHGRIGLLDADLASWVVDAVYDFLRAAA